MFKKTSCAILIFAILLTSSSNVFAQVNEELTTITRENQDEHIIDQNIINFLESRKIEYIITEGNIIQLENPNPEMISKLNADLNLEMNNSFNKDALSKDSVTLKSQYPTSFYHIKTWDRKTSKHFIKATKTAFASAVFGWIFGWAASANELSKLAAAGFGTYYFVEGNEENVYYSTKHSYQILGPGYFDSMGNHIGDYNMKRVDRTTKYSSHTGGQSITKYRRSTQLTAIP